MYKKNEGLSTLQWLGFMAVLAGMMCFGSGCAGIELGGRLGVYRVDERQESQKTYRNPKPAICYLLPSRCSEQTAQLDNDLK
jgi:hypothetical protein